MKKIVIAILLLINSFSLQGTNSELQAFTGLINSEIQLFKEWPLVSTVGFIAGGVWAYKVSKALFWNNKQSLTKAQKMKRIGLATFVALCTMKLSRAFIQSLLLPLAPAEYPDFSKYFDFTLSPEAQEAVGENGVNELGGTKIDYRNLEPFLQKFNILRIRHFYSPDFKYFSNPFC